MNEFEELEISEPKKNKRKLTATIVISVFLVALLAVVIALAVVTESFIVDGTSMLPYLSGGKDNDYTDGDKGIVDKVKKVMPAMTGPTISEVLSKEETVAVQAVIDEDVVFELVNDLRNAGAKDILVVPIERII